MLRTSENFQIATGKDMAAYQASEPAWWARPFSLPSSLRELRAELELYNRLGWALPGTSGNSSWKQPMPC